MTARAAIPPGAHRTAARRPAGDLTDVQPCPTVTAHLAPFTLDSAGGLPVGVVRTPDQPCTVELGQLRSWGAGTGVGIAEIGTAGEIDPADTQAIVALGGDGTILSALRYAAPLGVPVLGVNFGHVGFLADVDRAGLPVALDAISDGGATVEERSAIHLTAPGIDTLAANDIALARRYGAGPARVALTLKGTPLASLVGDGLVFGLAGRIDGAQPQRRRPGALAPAARPRPAHAERTRPDAGRARAARRRARHRAQRLGRARARRRGRRPRGRRDPRGRGGDGARPGGVGPPPADPPAPLLRRSSPSGSRGSDDPDYRGGSATEPSQ